MDPAQRRRRNNGSTWVIVKTIISLVIGLIGGLTIAAVFNGHFNEHLSSDYIELPRTRPTQGSTLNISESMGDLWTGSEGIFDDKIEAALWFTDADATTQLITTLLEAVPLSYEVYPGAFDHLRIPSTERQLTKRNTHLDIARTAFTEYSDVREELYRDILSNRVLWHWYADREVDVKFFGHIANMSTENTTGLELEHWEDAEEFARTTAVELIQTYRNIWAKSNAVKKMGKHLDTLKSNVQEAMSIEYEFMKYLPLKSAKNQLWNGRDANKTLPLLYTSVVKLSCRYKDITKGLKGMELILKNPPSPQSGFPTKGASMIAWSQVIEGLVWHWGTFLLNSQPGRLFAMRRETLKGVKDLRTYDLEKSWEQWRDRNCAGTTCHTKTTLTYKFGVWAGLRIPVLEGRAQDENAFCKRQTIPAGQKPNVWRGVYQQVCCDEESSLTSFIKYGPVDTISTPV
ncbi:uncharacterized protein GGS22DRAFT_162777 [Annulohypoxylon maeteangense]|uniref:uncharacterized protein n=1 Tax=Annulohypoxylon maeteangense TaxID=1927788 RepID=UPI002007EC93|nr:uncharacterized protein GGS22DRAFT_162777 [Annulohypoxylon maeteangense]KAI0885099.1 hypothetical protein GGS22DRAFT_162777 [Annulohypoxylon maeteangense]